MPNQPWLRDLDADASVVDKFLSFTTRVKATIYRHTKDPIQLTANVEGTALKSEGCVVAATMGKSLGSASAQWSLTVKSALNLEDEVTNGDWVIFWWERNGVRIHGTLGSIDSIRRTTTVVEGATVKTWSLAGRDFGKLFETTAIWFNEWASIQSNVGGRIFGKRMNYVPGGTPDAVCANLIDAFLGSSSILGGTWKLPKGLSYLGTKFTDALSIQISSSLSVTPQRKLLSDLILTGTAFISGGVGKKFSPPLRGAMFNELNLFQPADDTKLFDMLTEWSNPLLNELYFDVDVENSEPDLPTPSMILRERPFVTILSSAKASGLESPFFQLPTCRLRRRHFVADDLGSTDLERVNLFMLYADGMGLSQYDHYALYPPSIANEDIRRYGLRKMEKMTRFVGQTGSEIEWAEEMNAWHSLLVHWYGLNHVWLSGSMSTPFVYPEARPGYRLHVQGDAEEDILQGYIENVSHSWSFPKQGTTSLGITRGFRGDDDKLVQAVATRASMYRRTLTKGVLAGLDIGEAVRPLDGAGTIPTGLA